MARAEPVSYTHLILNLLPSGILHPDVTCVLGTGMVIDLDHLANEMQAIEARGVEISPKNLKLSDKATISMPWHKVQEMCIRDSVESDWDSLFAGLDAGRYDLVCNGVEVTEERAKTYDFTTPYGYIHTALAVRKDNEDIKSFEDLAGKTTANSPASTYMELAESYGATVQGIDTLEEKMCIRDRG